MTALNPVHDPSLMGPAILWVEDERTRAAVTECWFRDPAAKKIAVRAAGGRPGVEGLVRAARESGHKHVYGLVDRDFSAASRSRSVFQTDRHEFENHLLDFETLAKLHEHLDPDALRARAKERASSLLAWMAVRRTIHETKSALLLTPSDPTPEAVPDAEAAQRWFDSQRYPEDIEDAIRQTWTRNYLRANRFPKHLRDCEDELASDAWMTTFSGKEIFEHLAARGGWRHGSNDADEVSKLLVMRWRGKLPACASVLTRIRDAIVSECRL